MLQTPCPPLLSAAALSLPLSLCHSSNTTTKRCPKGRFTIFAVYGPWAPIFDVEDPRSKISQWEGKFLDFNQALEVARYDIQYLDWRARQDVLTIMLLYEKFVTVGSGGSKSISTRFQTIGTMKKELAELQDELSQAHNEVHKSEARVSAALDKLAYMEALVNDRLLQDRNTTEATSELPLPRNPTESPATVERKIPRKSLNVSGPVQTYSACLKNFWYPVAFSTGLKEVTMVPIDCFEEPWVIFRGKDGKPGRVWTYMCSSRLPT